MGDSRECAVPTLSLPSPSPLPIHDSRRRTDTSSSHDANRSFLTRAYPTMKHHNPHTPILIREAMNIQPRVFARYEFGKEKMADLQGLDDKAIEDKVSGLVQASQ